MILDERTEFADATAVTAVASTINVGDVIDTGGDGINEVDNLYLVIQVDTAVVSGTTNSTMQFRLVSDAVATPDLATATVHWTSGVIAEATLVAGYYVAKVALPQGVYERYLGIQAIIGVATTTAGKINAFLTPRPTSWKAFPEGVN